MWPSVKVVAGQTFKFAPGNLDFFFVCFAPAVFKRHRYRTFESYSKQRYC